MRLAEPNAESCPIGGQHRELAVIIAQLITFQRLLFDSCSRSDYHDAQWRVKSTSQNVIRGRR